MKKWFVFLALTLSTLCVRAQILDPVSWNTSAEKISDGVYRLDARADMLPSWHIYALTLPAEGPIPTEFVFPQEGYSLQGKMQEPTPLKSYDENFRMAILWHDGQPVFSQQIEITGEPLAQIQAEVTYMACNDQQCLPPETRTLTFRLPGGEQFSPAQKAPAAQQVPMTPLTPAKKTSAGSQATPDKNTAADAKTPARTSSEAAAAETVIGGQDGPTEIRVADSLGEDSGAQVEEAEALYTTQKANGRPEGTSSGLLGTFLFAFVAGLLALATPCVFPMIPMTVSFFMKRYSDRKKGIRDAMLYGLSIIAIYLILGVGVSAIFGAAALNAMSTDPWFNIFFFVLLVVFAASFFGAFELTLPSSWVNKMDRKSDRAGLVGIFFMAFTLALVSFSCTGPFVGTILVEAAVKGNFWGPVVGMAGFAIALALPFTLFALFPGWLSGLPKSGGWLNSVKVVLGFIELAFALKFLSNADMVLDWHLLEREVFIALWVVIFAMMGFYLLGKIRLPHDSPLESISVTRLFLALITLSFALYLVPGIWGAPVKIISAFAPPTTYSEAASAGGSKETLEILQIEPMSVRREPIGLPYRETGPQGIPVFTDLEQATTFAKAMNRPILLDFTGKACVNCRKMEADVWSDARVKELLSDEFVVVELYVDFREKLPESEQYTTPEGKSIRTVGQKWTDYQIRRFGSNSQPYYVITDPDDQVIAPTRAYDTDVEAYLAWLNEALETFRAQK